MATKRRTALLQSRVRLPVKRAPTKRAPSLSLKSQSDSAIATITRRVKNIDTEYYEIGQHVQSLDKREVWSLYGVTTFRAFLDQHVIPFTTARRMLAIAHAYTKKIAIQIGLERGFQLTRLARIDTKIRRTAQQLWTTNAKLGKAKRRVRSMTAAEIAALAQGALLRSKKRPTKPKATPTERTALRTFQSNWKELFDLKADIDLDLKKRVVHVEFSLDELLEE